ncbi:MAG: competence/damage-inducible protein A [Oscillospiraceae bacterium]|nr:competence/damage-inducible protein A [Oscillospiraceae bacterium]
MSTRKIQAEIITVGNELLNGRTVNTNASFLSRELQKLGFAVTNQTTVADSASEILGCLKSAIGRSSVIVFSGGLGPTDDDLTKETVARAIGAPLEEDPETLVRIRDFFESRGREMKDNNRKQALIPRGSTVLVNENGTAPGIYIRKGNQVIMMLPGPPHELEPMFTDKAAPLLLELSGQKINSRTLGVSGIGESELETMTKDLLYGDDPHAALYAKEGEVEICITSFGETDEEAELKTIGLIEQFREILGDHIYSENGENLAETAVRKLEAKKQRVAFAESCTGGLLAQMTTDVPGSSNVFEYGITSYGDWVKNASLGVDSSLLKKYTAISPAVAAEMARGARKNGRATYGVGVTGIAGPGVGAYLDKEVGEVYIAVCDRKKTVVKEFRFGDRRNRDNIRRLTAKNAFDMLRLFIDGKQIEGGVEFSNRKIADTERKDNPKSLAGLFARKAVSILVMSGIAAAAGYYSIKSVQAMSDRMTYDKLVTEYSEQVREGDRGEAFSKLADENVDFCGWLTNDSGDLDSVIVDGRGDGFYSSHDFYKGTNRLGCTASSAGLPIEEEGEIPKNIAIKSSSLGKEVLFFHLPDYRNVNYAASNQKITLYGKDFTAVYKVISAFFLDENEDLDRIFFDSDLSDRDEYYEYVINLKMRSFFDANYSITEDDRFITLYAPCDEWDGAVFVVCGCLMEEGNDSEIFLSENDVVLYPATWYEIKGTQSGVNVTAEMDRWYEWLLDNSEAKRNQE